VNNKAHQEQTLMPYCRKCGTGLPEGADYCPNCGSPVAAVARLTLADWGVRFVAYLIDMVILGAIIAPLKWFVAWMIWPWEPWVPRFMSWIHFIDLGPSSVIYFLYWTFMEGGYGQSIGKMIMKIKVTRLNGEPIDMAHAAIESLGKAFLLPIDCIIGWILYPTKKQRLFNYISDTIIVKATSH